MLLEPTISYQHLPKLFLLEVGAEASDCLEGLLDAPHVEQVVVPAVH